MPNKDQQPSLVDHKIQSYSQYKKWKLILITLVGRYTEVWFWLNLVVEKSSPKQSGIWKYITITLYSEFLWKLVQISTYCLHTEWVSKSKCHVYQIFTVTAPNFMQKQHALIVKITVLFEVFDAFEAKPT